MRYAAFCKKLADGSSAPIAHVGDVPSTPLPSDVRLMACAADAAWCYGWAAGWADRAQGRAQRHGDSFSDPVFAAGYAQGHLSRMDAEDTAAMFGGPII